RVLRAGPNAEPRHKGLSLLAAEKDAPGLTIGRDIDKVGYKGIETCEVNFEAFRVPVANLVGGVEGRGLQQVLSGLEVGRINIASRAVASRRARSRARSATRRRGQRSGRRFAGTRRSSWSPPTWPPGSRRARASPR